MSADNAPIRLQLARSFLSALRPALEPRAEESARLAAREAAQMLGLTGLDRALASLQALAGATLPRDVTSIAGRIQRLAAESETAGDTRPFEVADRELGELASEIEAYDWRDGETEADPEHPAVATLPLDRVFDETLLADDESHSIAGRLRLSPPVAASLRAALDWLMPENPSPASIHLRGEPSLLEVRLAGVQSAGIAAAERVLSAVGGNLGPVVEGDVTGDGDWLVRVPSFAARPSYLMVIQGGLRIAIPWHAVLRLRMLSPAEMTQVAWRHGHPVLDFIATPSPNAIEYPVVLIAHGLKRAYFVADRLIWRLAAESCENEWGSPAAGLNETVRSEEGEIFWVADPGRLLEHVPVPDLPVREAPIPAPPMPAPTDHALEPPVPAAPMPAPTDHALEPPAPAAPMPAPTDHALEPPVPAAPMPTLTDRDVEPLGLPVAPPLPAPPPPVAPHAPVETSTPVLEIQAPQTTVSEPTASRVEPPPAAPHVTPSRRLALMADDSITARVFLTRLLYQAGIEVAAVATASDLLERLAGAPWDLVFVDADLPDGHGTPWLVRAREAVAAVAPGARVVALVRDRTDLDCAHEAGIGHTLTKPIDPEDLARLLATVPGGMR